MDIARTSSEQMEGKHVSIDIDKLSDSVEGQLKILHPFSDKCSIYRVPKRLRMLNEKAYTPQIISIGPLHHGKEEFKAMDEHKNIYLQEFLKLSKVSVKDFITAIAERESRLRNSYAETTNIRSEEFVKMMLLDCSFVLMVLLKYYSPALQSSNDRIFGKPRMIREIKSDMCLLENQLPFFILEDLFDLSEIVKNTSSIIELTHVFLKSTWSSWVTGDVLEQISFSQVEHFVDFLRICQLPKNQPQRKRLETLSLPSVLELYQSAIKFEFGSSQNLLHIKFNCAESTIEIPRLEINDSTENLLRNLQAFEQCHRRDTRYVNHYITMLSLLVHDTKDVEILVTKGIIDNWLRDNQAVFTLLHNLAKENLIDSTNFYFSGVVADLNKHCKKRRHKWKATLKQNYFNNPWVATSVIAAGILLILTVIQTVCSIIQVI